MMPYKDCLANDKDFQAIHRIGLTGILRGEGKTVGWSNECRFRCDEPLRWSDLYLEDYYGIPYNSSDATLSGEEFLSLLKKIKGEELSDALGGATTITRRQAARLIDEHLDPFSIKVNWSGKLQVTR